MTADNEPKYDTTEATHVFLRAHEKCKPSVYDNDRKAAKLALYKAVIQAAEAGGFIVDDDDDARVWIGLPSKVGGSLVLTRTELTFASPRSSIDFDHDLEYDPVSKLFVGPVIEAGKPERRSAVTLVAEVVAGEILALQKALG